MLVAAEAGTDKKAGIKKVKEGLEGYLKEVKYDEQS